MRHLPSCDVDIGICFGLIETDVPEFEKSYRAASINIQKMIFEFWNAPTVFLSSKLLFYDLCSLTIKISSFGARFECRMKHNHTRVRSAIKNIDSANETSMVEPPSGALLSLRKEEGLLRNLNRSWAGSQLNRNLSVILTRMYSQCLLFWPPLLVFRWQRLDLTTQS